MKLDLATKEDIQVLEEKLDRVINFFTAERTSVKEEWMKSSEVKTMLKCSDASLKNYRDSGALPSSKIGGTYYYAKAEVDSMLLNRMQLNHDRFCEDDSKG